MRSKFFTVFFFLSEYIISSATPDRPPFFVLVSCLSSPRYALGSMGAS